MTYLEFVNKWKGRYLEFADANNKYQCVDLMRKYIQDVWGLDPYVLPRAIYAKYIYQNFTSTTKLKKIPNTPTGIPKRGDIIFWGTYPFITGIAGHVAVVDTADVNNVICFSQNYPTYAPCILRRFNYKGIMGWIHKN